MKRHSTEEIAAKLRQAGDLIARGHSQAEACKALGFSVMTYHRWRKLQPAHSHDLVQPYEMGQVTPLLERISNSEEKRMADLRTENERLRRIVTDLLLEKMKIEEQLGLNTRDKPVGQS